jgi:hypothetical protein
LYRNINIMQDLTILISGIEYKLRKLIANNVNLKIENKLLSEKNNEFLKTIENQNKIIKELEEKNKVLKIVKSIEKSTNSFDQKIKINEMLREIDKCIGLLNK